MSKRNWDNYFIGIAKEASKMATCDRLHVGCVLVRDRKIVSTGFNGSVSGHDHCDDVGHLYNDEGRCIRTLHAEMNAILQCAVDGKSSQGATAYVTHEPCENCTKILNGAGIKEVVFLEAYNNKYNQHFSKGMKVYQLVDGKRVMLRG